MINQYLIIDSPLNDTIKIDDIKLNKKNTKNKDYI